MKKELEESTSEAPRRWAKFLVESSPTARFQTSTTAQSMLLLVVFLIIAFRTE